MVRKLRDGIDWHLIQRSDARARTKAGLRRRRLTDGWTLFPAEEIRGSSKKTSRTFHGSDPRFCSTSFAAQDQADLGKDGRRVPFGAATRALIQSSLYIGFDSCPCTTSKRSAILLGARSMEAHRALP